jgi:hypothetical protein
MSEDVIRVQGPDSERARCRWKPRLSSSEPVRHVRSTAPSAPVASNDISSTAVGAGGVNAKVPFAVRVPVNWNSRMSVLMTDSIGVTLYPAAPCARWTLT